MIFERAKPDDFIALSGATWNAMCVLLELIEPLKAEVAALRLAHSIKHIAFFFARITGNTALGAEVNRYKYAWSEVFMDDDDSIVKTSGRSGTTTTDYALNICEDANDGTGIQAPGIDIDGSAYPAGFALQPIQGNPIVPMWAIRTLDGDVVKYVFCMPNAHDGDC